jgi:hypothetical protein
MLYRIAADVTVFLHLLWIVFLIIGAFWGRQYRWIKGMHVSGMCLAFVIQVFGWYCPLTYLEVWFRKMHDPSQGYAGSYIIHYIERVVYIDVPREVIFILTILLALISLWLYLHKSTHAERQNK